MSQTSISTKQAVAYPGMLADLGNKYTESMVSEEASAEIPFGVCVAQGVADSQCELPDASGDKLVGMVQHSHAYAKGDGGELGTTGLKPKACVNVLRKGRMYVVAETTIAAGDRLFVRYAAGAGGTQLGALRNAAVASETIDATAQGVFRTGGVAGTLVVLEVDFTNKP